ncbi:MAG: MBL fold metallo-hydrolase [Vicinamibacterales bacterium]
MSSPRPIIRRVVTGRWKENTFLVRAAEGVDGVIVDPGCDASAIDAAIDAMEMRVRAVLLTHAHYDHVWSTSHIQSRTAADVYLHEGDTALLRRVNAFTLVLGLEHIPVPAPTHLLRGGEEFGWPGLSISVMHLPGHTRGSVSYRVADDFFVGDTVLPGSVGRTDLPGSDPEALVTSVRRLVDALDDRSVIHPGHGLEMGREAILMTNDAVRSLMEPDAS